MTDKQKVSLTVIPKNPSLTLWGFGTTASPVGRGHPCVIIQEYLPAGNTTRGGQKKDNNGGNGDSFADPDINPLQVPERAPCSPGKETKPHPSFPAGQIVSVVTLKK